jgi:hypothetical protein
MVEIFAESASSFGFEHPFGGAVSILGALLLSIGWVGKQRLERWDDAVGKFVERTKIVRRRLGDFGWQVVREFANPTKWIWIGKTRAFLTHLYWLSILVAIPTFVALFFFAVLKDINGPNKRSGWWYVRNG